MRPLVVGALLLRMGLGAGVDEMEVVADVRKQRRHIADSTDLLAYVCLLVLTMVTMWVFKKKRIWFLHESGLSIMFGLLVGAILRYGGGHDSNITALDVVLANSSAGGEEGDESRAPPDIVRLNMSKKTLGYGLLGVDSDTAHHYNDVQEKATFDSEIFFYVILPPIIFHAGYSMRKKHFFDNLGSILTFALLGTIISTLIIAALTWLCGQLISVKVTFLETLYFGSIVSATDPVTTLAIFTDLNVDPLMNSLVLGESLLNDAVAIVLCGAIEDYSALSLSLKGTADTFETEAFLRTIGNFFLIFFGSIGLGALIGVLTSILTKFTRVKDYQMLETSLFFLMSYSSYLIAEVCQMSGIVSVLFCGIFQAHYTFHNLSLESKVRTQQLFEVLHFLLENFIFSYIGVSMFTFAHHKFVFSFILTAFLAIAVARAFNIYPLSFILNLGRKNKIPMNFQHMLWFSGLRGAMAFALAMQNTMTDARQMFLTTTSLITIITVIFCGGLTDPLLSLLRIPTGVPDQFTIGPVSPPSGDCQTPSTTTSTLAPGAATAKSALARGWKRLDARLLKPLLTNSQPTLEETAPWLGRVARWLTPTDQMSGEHIARQSVEGDLVCNNFDNIERGDRAESLSSGD